MDIQAKSRFILAKYGRMLPDLAGVGSALLGLFLLVNLKSAQINKWFYLACVIVVCSLLVFFWYRAFIVSTSTENLRHWIYNSLLRPNKLVSVKVQKTKVETIDALTGLRIIAAAMVYFYHLYFATAVTPRTDLPVLLGNILKNGYLGVPIFFTLSGFVICYTYYTQMRNNLSRNYWPFLVARFARLYPMYFFVCVLGIASSPLVIQNFKLDPELLLQFLTTTQIWPNLGLNINTFTFIAPTWSIGVEFFLYLLFPFLVVWVFKFCRKIWQLLLLGGLIGLAALALPSWFVFSGTAFSLNEVPLPLSWEVFYWLYYFPVPHLADFMLGCIAARIYILCHNNPVNIREKWLGRAGLFLSLGAIILLMLYDKPSKLTFYRTTAGYLPFITLLIFCLARYRTSLSILLSSRPFVLLGEASYSFYLLHIYFVNTNIRFLAKPGDPNTYFYGGMAFIILCLLSLGAYTYIEAPARRFIRKFLT